MSGGRGLRLGLLGHPVGHSLSAVMHEAALDALGLAGRYDLLDTPPEALDERVQRLRGGGLDGLNVTIPHKEAVAALCDHLSGDAAALGAVNTLVRARGDRVEGHNTDLPGLVDALDARWPGRPWMDGPACVVGAGGAARAAVLAAFLTGAVEVRVLNRTRERADVLAEALGPHVPGPLRACGEPPDALAEVGLVLQATSMGMGTTPNAREWADVRDRARATLDAGPAACVLYDLVYRPERTPWVAAARDTGRDADSGLEMLVRQAGYAFRLWTGREAPLDVMRAAARAALGPAPRP
ncbi:MAG: shikimate dehydrogenase family protein [Myxococcota bacterium]